jgi:hypothetical protein
MTTAIDHDGLSPPDTKAGRLQRAVLDLLRRHEAEDTVPTNVRFLFYELEQAGVLPKAYRNGDGSKRARQPPQDISDAAMRLREIGLVPWEWLIDETRDVSERRYAASAYEYVVDTLPMIRIDCWGGEPPPLVICEARSTRGVLERIATDEYLCPITATGGQCGGHIVNEVAPLLADDRKVLYLGDCEVDGPGDQIEANTRDYVERHAGCTFTAETWVKVALTSAQVARSSRLRALAISKVDHRYRPPRPYQAIECEAVGQATLERMLRRALDGLLPEPLATVRVREAAERGRLARAIGRMGRRR